MYYYIYDIFTAESRYKNDLNKAENILSNLGISGRIYKLNVLKKIEEIVDDAINNRIKNIVAIGNDQTIGKIFGLLVDKNIALGIIPVGDKNNLANYFGIHGIEQACQIICARKITEIDVGKINGQYFLTSVESKNNDIYLELNNFNIAPRSNNCNIGVYNLCFKDKNINFNPRDGLAEAIFWPYKINWWQKIINKNKNNIKASIFPINKITIKHQSKEAILTIDEQKIIKTPAELEILKRKLKLIVGKIYS